MDAVKVYTKDDCPACTATLMWLERRGIPFEAEPFEQSEQAQALAQLHSFRTAPLCTYRGEVWAGFRPDLLAGCYKT